MRSRCPAALAFRAVLATSVVVAPAARADAFDPRDPDKAAHLATSYALTLTVAIGARHFEVPRWQAVALAAATTLVLGTAKELTDETGYAWGDQLANGIGAAAAVGVVFVFEL